MIKPKRSMLKTFSDAIVNHVTGQGTSRDGSTHNQFARVTVTEHMAATLYTDYWLARKIVNIPIKDMMKNGRTFSDESMDKDALERYSDAWRKFGVDKIIAKALRIADVFGGAVIVPIGTDPKLEDPFNPRDFTNGRLLRFVVIPGQRLSVTAGVELEQDITSPWFGMPEYITKGGVAMHISQLIIAHGEENLDDSLHRVAGSSVPSFLGYSTYQDKVEPIMNAHAAYGSLISMMQSNNVDYLKVPELYENLIACAGDSVASNDLNTAVMNRALMFAQYKSMHNLAIVDSEEGIERLRYDFSNLDRVLGEMVTAVSGCSSIPLTRLAGISPGGMNATGESDLHNYNAEIDSRAEVDLRPLLEGIDRVLTLHVFGEERQLQYEINSPDTPTEKELEERKKAQTDRIKSVSDMGVVPDSVVLRELQQGPMPNITDDLISEVEAEELINASHDDDPDDDPDDTQEIDPDDTSEIDDPEVDPDE